MDDTISFGVVEPIVSTPADAALTRSHAAGRARIRFSPALMAFGTGHRVGDSRQPVTVVPVAALR